MNHEFWNEIGNLYFLCGAYEPAIHAYLRSIKLDNTFGRSYSNLAMAYVQSGKYRDAIGIYLRGIELLADEKEKAATWNNLGLLYRQIKEYDLALEAYQRADLIAPQDDEKLRADAPQPLTVSMPEIDLASILAKGNFFPRQNPGDLTTEINAEFSAAEETAQPDFETFAQPEEILFKPQASAQSDWKLAYAENPPVAADSAPAAEAAPQEDSAPLILLPEETSAQVEPEFIIPLEDKSIAAVVLQADTSVAYLEEPAVDETDSEAAQYSQTDYMLDDLSPEEQQKLEMEIIKYQEATAKNPRSYILWESLGDAYKSFGQYKNAIYAFQTAIMLNPVNAMNHYRLGLVYAAERKHHEAIKAFQKVVELEPTLPQAHASLASQYRKMGMEEAARMHIEKARALQMDDESYYNHACFEALCGNNDRAFALLTAALEAKQTYVNWVRCDPDLDNLREDRRFKEILAAYATVT